MKEKILKISILVVLLFFTITNIVNALSCTASMTPSSTNVDEGTEFIVTLKINNMDVGSSEGFSTVTGSLKYDTTIFETVTQSAFDKLNNWNPTYEAETNKLTLRSSIAAKTDTSICQITFKTKSEIKKTTGKATTGTIKFEDITAYTADNETPVSSISTTITIGAVEDTNANINTNVNTNSISVVQNNTTNVPSYSNVVNETKEEIAEAGSEDTAFVLLVAAVIIGIVFYVKFEKIHTDIN